jgi:hypothetical protein
LVSEGGSAVFHRDPQVGRLCCVEQRPELAELVLPVDSDGYADDPERTASDLRRQGIARRLLREALQRDGGLRIDFISYAGHVSG